MLPSQVSESPAPQPRARLFSRARSEITVHRPAQPNPPINPRFAPLPPAAVSQRPAPPRPSGRGLIVQRSTARKIVLPYSLSFVRDSGYWLLFAVIVAFIAFGLVFLGTRRSVTLTINDLDTTMLTHQQTVRGVLNEAGLKWHPEDIIRPGLNEAVPPDGKISIHVAMPIVISADGNLIERRTQASTVLGVFRENNIQLKAQDQVFLDGRLVHEDTALPRFAATAGHPAMLSDQTGPVHITVTRSLPISVNDNGALSTIYTTDSTLGSALAHSGVLVFLGDYVSPDLTTPVSVGESVFIRRSRPATIEVDGQTIKTRTCATNVAELLKQEGIQLEGKDYASPSPTTDVVDDIKVSVTRVREEYHVESESIPYETKVAAQSEYGIGSACCSSDRPKRNKESRVQVCVRKRQTHLPGLGARVD